MKTIKNIIAVAIFTGCSLYIGSPQAFSSGSDGSYGAMNIVSNTTLPLPPDGRFNCSTIQVASGVTLKFTRNALNTPAYLLATNIINIQGIISVSGENAVAGGAGS